MHSVAWWWKPRHPRPSKCAEPDLLLELLIVALDAPAQLGVIDQPRQGDVVRKGREPIFGRLVLALWPLDQQPLFRPAFGEPVIAMRDANTHARKARGQRALQHLRAIRSCATRLGKPSASSLTEIG